MLAKRTVLAAFAIGMLATQAKAAEPRIKIETTFTRMFGDVTALSAKELTKTPDGSWILSGNMRVEGTKGGISAPAGQDAEFMDVYIADLPTRAAAGECGDTIAFGKSSPGSMVTAHGPEVLVASGEEAMFELSDPPVHYFERQGETWQLKENSDSGITISMKPVVRSDGRIVFESVSLKAIAVAGRQPIPGTSLEAGAPILEAHSSEISFEANSGQKYWVCPKVDEAEGALLVGIRATVVDGEGAQPTSAP